MIIPKTPIVYLKNLRPINAMSRPKTISKGPAKTASSKSTLKRLLAEKTGQPLLWLTATV